MAALRERGLWGSGNTSNGFRPLTPTPSKARRVIGTERYDALDIAGNLVAIHQRTDYDDGSKGFAWLHPDGRASHKGELPSKAMPLFGIARAQQASRGVLVEGEKAQLALVELRITSVGSVTGASSTPNDDVLRAVLHWQPIYLWPDNDQQGVQHMLRIAARLVALGAPDVRIVRWTDAPPKGDAADFVAAGATAEDVKRLLATAEPWTPEPEPVADGPRLDIVAMSQVEAVPVDWLWERWLARGKLALIGGHVGDGKSTLTTAIAATLSRGGRWPDGTRAPVGNTLFLLAEDALDDTLKPRLILHGADCDRVFALRAVRDPDGRERGFSLAKHLPELEAAIIRHDITLIVIDPLSSFMPGSDRNGEEVRDILIPLVQVIDRHSVAGLGVMHLGKPNGGGARRAVQMLLGATAFGATARIVWALAAGPTDDDPNRRVLGVVKTNVSMKPTSRAFTRAEDGPITWMGETTDDIEALIAGTSTRNDAKTPERADIIELLTMRAEPMRPAEISEALDMPEGSVRKMLRKMLDVGNVTQPSYGLYSVVTLDSGNTGNSWPSELPVLPESSVTTTGTVADTRVPLCWMCGLLLFGADVERGVHTECEND